MALLDEKLCALDLTIRTVQVIRDIAGQVCFFKKKALKLCETELFPYCTGKYVIK